VDDELTADEHLALAEQALEQMRSSILAARAI
jgi:hypothetical protein